MTSYLMRILPALGLSLAACAAVGPQDEVGVIQSELRGHYEYTDCAPGRIEVIEKAALYNRTASRSTAFRECMSRKILQQQPVNQGAPYRACIGDPFEGADRQTQFDRAMSVAVSPNAVHITCLQTTPDQAPPLFAGIGAYGNTDPESLTLSSWVGPEAEDPACDANCRFTVYQFIGQKISHEVMHQHGYLHDHGNPNETPAQACGYEGDPSWDFMANTMPYVLDDCIGQVLRESFDVCPDMDGCSRGVNLVTQLGSLQCLCVDDSRSDW